MYMYICTYVRMCIQYLAEKVNWLYGYSSTARVFMGCGFTYLCTYVGVQRLKSRKRSASSEAGVHHAKRKPSSSSTHPTSSYAGPLRSPAKLTGKARSSDSNVVDVKKRLLRAKLIKCIQDVDQRNKTIAKQK